MPLQIRRGTQAERGAMTVPLATGELLYVTDDQRLYIGNGTTLGGVQITGYTDADAKDAAAAIFAGGAHSGITFTYDTIANTMDATVDLSSYNGAITATAFKGTLTADDSTILIDAVDGKINLDGTVKGNIVPDANETYDLGSASYRFRDLYLSGSSIKLGSATITSVGSAINLPAGSTVGGQAIAYPTSESLVVDIQGSVFADDSSVMVDAVQNKLVANEVATGVVNAEVGPLIVQSSYFNPLEVQGLIGGQLPSVTVNSAAGTLTTPTDTVANDIIGSFKVQGWNDGDYKFASGVVTRWSSDADFTFNFPNSDLLFVLGNNSNSQPITAYLLASGTFYAPTLQTGIYTTTPSDTRPTGAKGMIIFNDTSGKFQGFDGSSWVDLS